MLERSVYTVCILLRFEIVKYKNYPIASGHCQEEETRNSRVPIPCPLDTANNTVCRTRDYVLS